MTLWVVCEVSIANIARHEALALSTPKLLKVASTNLSGSTPKYRSCFIYARVKVLFADFTNGCR